MRHFSVAAGDCDLFDSRMKLIQPEIGSNAACTVKNLLDHIKKLHDSPDSENRVQVLIQLNIRFDSVKKRASTNERGDPPDFVNRYYKAMPNSSSSRSPLTQSSQVLIMQNNMARQPHPAMIGILLFLFFAGASSKIGSSNTGGGT